MDVTLESPERLRLAAELIRQSPPGQVNDVIAGEQNGFDRTSRSRRLCMQCRRSHPDIQVILDNHPDLAAAASEQLKLYNLEQFSVITLTGQNEAVRP